MDRDRKHFATSECQKISQLKQTLPQYEIVKLKVSIENLDADLIIRKFTELWKDKTIDVSDGIRMDDEEGWVHIRKSNTEPILRVIGESSSSSPLSSREFCQRAIQAVPELSSANLQ